MIRNQLIIPSNEIGARIIRLINEAKQELMLISPYCDFLRWQNLTEAIEKAIGRGVYIKVFKKLEKNENLNTKNLVDWLYELGVHIFEVRNLHLKLYVSEDQAIQTSMNLLWYSHQYSIEGGIWTNNKIMLSDFKKYYCIPIEREAKKIGYEIIFTVNIPTLADYFR